MRELIPKKLDLQLDPAFFEFDRRPVPREPNAKKPPVRIINVFEKITVPPEGGIYRHYKGMKYPIKGFPFEEAITAIDMVKSYTMTVIHSFAQKELKWLMLGFIIMPWKKKIKILQNALDRYIDFANRVFNRVKFRDGLVGTVYMKRQYYSKFSRSIWIVVRIFFLELGIKHETADDVGKIIATIFEYDDAYRYRVEDLMSETNKYDLRVSAFREIKRLLNIYQRREGLESVILKFRNVVKILRVALLSRKIRDAFRSAIFDSYFIDLQLDEADRHHVLQWDNYNFLGKTIEERQKMYLEMYGDNLPEVVEVP